MPQSDATAVPGVYRDLVTVQCNLGHVAYDNSISNYVTECQSDGTWNDTAPCTRKLSISSLFRKCLMKCTKCVYNKVDISIGKSIN